MILRLPLVSVAFLTMTLCVSSAYAAELALNTEEYPPYNFVAPTGDNSVIGIATDAVREIMTRAGVNHAIRLMPWKRAYDNALTQPGNCVYSTTMTEERMPLFKWVGPIVANDWAMFTRAGAELSLASLAEVGSRTIGGYQGDAIALYLDSQGYTLDLAVNDRLNVRKLEAGRIDLWASGSKLAPYLAKSEGVRIKPLFTFRETEMGLACHKSVADRTIEALQAALETIKTDGTMERIEANYR